MPHGRLFLILAFIAILAGGFLLLNEDNGLPPDGAAGPQGLRALAQAGAAQSGETGTEDVPVGQSVVLPPVTPVTRRMADVAIDTTGGDSMYERWERGEIPWKDESIVGIVEYKARQEASLRYPPLIPVQTATTGPGALAPTMGTGFDSIDYTNSGGAVPPDPELAVGPNHIIAVVNVAVAMYDKNGNTVFGPTAAENLFSLSSCTSGLYDPNVIYDEEAGRWFLAYDQGPQSSSGGYCVLASTGGDPTGGWHEYFFPLNDSSGWLDYPHAGVGDQFIFMGGNIFGISGGFVEGRIYAFDKADLYAGNPVSAIARGLGSTIDTPQPLNLHGAGTGTWPTLGNEHYFLGEPYDGANYTLLRWNPTDDTLVNLGNINLGAAGMPVDVIQNGPEKIQANDFRPLDFEYRNGYGWTAMTVACDPGNGTTVNCARWAQIDLANASLGPAGSGVYGSDNVYRFFPDLAVNDCGDMAIGYTKSSSSIYPSIWVTGRENGDPAGDLQPETEMKAGEIAYDAFDGDPHRWGDYTGMTIDPDGLTFWYLGEYSKITNNANGRWGTYIASFTYDGCSLSDDFALDTVPATATICTPDDAVYTNTVTALQNFSSPVTLSTSGNPGSASFDVNPVTPDGDSVLTIGGAPAGDYSFDIVGSGGGVVHTNTVSLLVQDTVPGVPTLLSPADGATGVATRPAYTWSDVGALSYYLEVAADADFDDVLYDATVIDTAHTQANSLDANSTYYWRVTAQNACGSAPPPAAASFTTQSNSLACNGGPVPFESGIPGDWQVVDNTGGQGIVWTTTAAPECGIDNLTGASGEAACADSDLPGSGAPAYDTELVSNHFDLPANSIVTLDAAAYYRDLDTGSNDTFSVDVWDGSSWNNVLTWDEDHEPDDIVLDLSPYAGLAGVRVRFAYAGDGWDWYAQVDDVALTCVGTPAIGTSPAVESLQAAGQRLTHTLTISNTGSADLNWSLFEEPAPQMLPAPQTEEDPAAERAPAANPTPEASAPGHPLFQLDVGAATGSALILGVEYVDDYYWVTAAGISDTSDPNYLYKLDGTGNVVSSTTQATTSTWGWRDLAYDGAYLYGSDSGVLDQIDPATGLATGTTIPCPENPCRALAYDPATDHFWTQNFGGSLYEFDRSGTVINTFSTGLAAYGAAWDATAGDSYLWIWSQDGPDGRQVTATQIDPATGTSTGAGFLGAAPPGGLAGGATIAADLLPGRRVLVGMHQAASDTIVGYDLTCSNVGEVTWLSAAPTGGTTAPAEQSAVDVAFDATGLADGTYGASLCVESNDPATPLVSVPVTLTVDACAGTPPATPALTGTVQNGTDLLLSWSTDLADYGYEVHASADPYFDPGGDTRQAVYDGSQEQHVVPGVIGDGTASFHRLLSLNCNGSLTAASNPVGEFEFGLTPGAP